jgi:methylenetetrahydrofolate--tRNA-(uracil-5-)-methyltransferase
VETKNFQPVNITFGLLEPLPEELRKKYRKKRERHEVQVGRALEDWNAFMAEMNRREAEQQGVGA